LDLVDLCFKTQSNAQRTSALRACVCIEIVPKGDLFAKGADKYGEGGMVDVDSQVTVEETDEHGVEARFTESAETMDGGFKNDEISFEHFRFLTNMQ
jgi:hypothetical protein